MNDVYIHSIINYWRGIYKVLEDDWQKAAKDLGLTTAEQHLLWILHFEKEATMTEIADIGLWDISTVVQIVNRLKKKGLIETKKRVHDRRISYCILTEEGLKKRKESEKYRYKSMEYLKALSNNEETKDMIPALLEFQKNFNQHFHGESFVKWVDKTTKNLES